VSTVGAVQHAWQGGGGGGSPKRWVNGDREEGGRLIDVPRRRRGPVAGEGGDEVLQLEEEMGEVRRGPKGVDGGGTTELTEGGKNDGDGSKYGEGRRLFGHRCEREVKGRGGALRVRFEGRMGEGGERGVTASGGAF
jgi:hypothetical protein